MNGRFLEKLQQIFGNSELYLSKIAENFREEQIIA